MAAAAAAYTDAIALLRAGNSESADATLHSLGHRFRLADPFWRPLSADRSDSDDTTAATTPTQGAASAATGSSSAQAVGRRGRKGKRAASASGSDAIAPPLYALSVVDNALPSSLVAAAAAALAPDAAFWSEHGYPTPNFFSYRFPFAVAPKSGIIGALAAVIREHATPLLQGRPVTHVEWWAHSRDRSSGAHQLHFDLDEKALLEHGQVRSPAVSCVVYLTGDGGAAPTVVTDEGIDDSTTEESAVASAAVRVAPIANRLLMFDGSKLHGVPPVAPQDEDAGAPAEPRITLMFGLWSEEPVGSPAPVWRGKGRSAGFRNLGPNMPHPRAKLAQWPSQLLTGRGAVKSLPSDPAPKVSTAGLDVITPVWVPIEKRRATGGHSKKRRKVDRKTTGTDAGEAGDPGAYVGKWFVTAPSEIRDEALVARDWAQRAAAVGDSDNESTGVVEFVDAAELARLRAL